jgi:RNA polymerase sigma factor
MFFYAKTLEEKVAEAKSKKEEANALIARFKPFIASVVRKQAGKFLEYGVDEELSVGLMAFKEAIDTYNEGRGRFLSYARIVIKNRLIDFYRKQNKQRTLRTLGSDEVVQEELEKKSFENYRIDSEEIDRKLEIIDFTAVLAKWGISLITLAKISPRSDSDKKVFQDIASMIVNDKALLNILLETKRLPIKEIEKRTFINRKKVERARLYIISMVLAIMTKVSYLEINKDGLNK